jgi:hypothetical protein
VSALSHDACRSEGGNHGVAACTVYTRVARDPAVTRERKRALARESMDDDLILDMLASFT